MPDYSHVLFGDESHHNGGRYRSVGILSARRAAAVELHRWYVGVLAESGRSSLEFKKLNDRRLVPVVSEVVTGVVQRVRRGAIRADVLVWDTTDKRHAIVGRDDRANLGRMYYHCIRTCLAMRWPNGALWRAMIDENALADYAEFQRILDGKTHDPDPTVALREDLAQDESLYTVAHLESVTAEDQPLVQIADLLAGLAVVSRSKYAGLCSWRDARNGQRTLLGEQPSEGSNRERNQFGLIQHLRREAGRLRLGVSLDSTRGLETKDPKRPLNFWLYRPQHDLDQAPLRERRQG